MNLVERVAVLEALMHVAHPDEPDSRQVQYQCWETLEWRCTPPELIRAVKVGDLLFRREDYMHEFTSHPEQYDVPCRICGWGPEHPCHVD